MRRFTFRLARLERTREIGRRKARVVLATSVGRLRAARELREDRERQLAEGLESELPQELSDDSRAWRQLAAWRETCGDRVAEAVADESRAAEAVAGAVEVHAAAARRHRILERLRERRFRRWVQENELEERRFLDETHLLRVVRERAAERSGEGERTDDSDHD